MNKITIASASLALSISLVGCHTMNRVGEVTGNTVGAGTKVVSTGTHYATKTVYTGTRGVLATGATATQGVGRTVGATMGVLTGQPVKYQKTNANMSKEQVFTYKGKQYRLVNGRATLIR